jgi:hypothetical protein
MQQDHRSVADLEKLAAELAVRGCEARLITPAGRPPWLAVASPHALRLPEAVMAEGEWFWWPHAERIAPVADVAQAVGVITRTLAASSAEDGQP